MDLEPVTLTQLVLCSFAGFVMRIHQNTFHAAFKKISYREQDAIHSDYDVSCLTVGDCIAAYHDLRVYKLPRVKVLRFISRILQSKHFVCTG